MRPAFEQNILWCYCNADGNLEDLQQEAGPVSAAWARLSQQFHAAAEAAAAMGLLDKEVAEYKDYFVQYGDYLLGALPRPALQQAGLLHDEPLSSTQVQQQQQQGEDEEEAGDAEDDALYEEFGMLQLKNDTSGDMFEAMGFDLEALLACVAEA